LHAESCPLAATDDTLTVAKGQLQLMESRLQSFLQLGREPSYSENKLLNLAELVEELLPLVLPAARHADVKVDWQSSDNEVLVLGRRETLGMVIVNLLLNAIEAAQKHDFPGVESHVGIELKQDLTGNVELVVSDTGGGLEAEVADNLFKPFVTTKPEGVGLGLAVAQQVAQAHGGKLSWTRDGNHTRFLLRLPVAAGANSTERNGIHV
jgi:C4-dicarboxylate-specific signal transduction histidine kinase